MNPLVTITIRRAFVLPLPLLRCGSSAPAMFDWQAELAPSPIKLGISKTPVPPPMMLTTTPTAQMITAASKPSFVQALRGKSALSDPLPVPSIRGDMLSVKITDDVYARGLDFCKTNLRGRLVLNKGDKPFSSKDLAAIVKALVMMSLSVVGCTLEMTILIIKIKIPMVKGKRKFR